MITRDQIPSQWSISWFRAYDLGNLASLPPRVVLKSGAVPGAEFPDIDAQAFFDIQALRHGHVARMRLPPIQFDGVLRLTEGDREVTGKVAVHLLAHASGFVVIRPTLRAEWFHLDGDRRQVEVLNQLERAFWVADYPLNWHVAAGRKPLPGGVRRLMNWVFLDLYERACGNAAAPTTLLGWAHEGIQGCDRLHRMLAEGSISYPFPVSFGTQFELIGAVSEVGKLLAGLEPLAQRLLAPDDPAHQPLPIDLGPGSGLRRSLWYLGESHALTLASDRPIDTTMDAYDSDRTQVLEFLTLRRGVLRCVQRDTQKALTERQAITRRQVERWQHMVASTTDNYILHDRIGRLIEPVQRHINEMIEIRDLADLERQVRGNLTWFQDRIDTLAEWTGGLIGAAVGTAAMVLSLQEPVKGLLGQLIGVSADDVVNKDAALFGAVMVLLMLVSFVICLLGVRVFTSRLRPFAHDLPTRRLRRRRRPARPATARKERPAPGPSHRNRRYQRSTQIRQSLRSTRIRQSLRSTRIRQSPAEHAERVEPPEPADQT